MKRQSILKSILILQHYTFEGIKYSESFITLLSDFLRLISYVTKQFRPNICVAYENLICPGGRSIQPPQELVIDSLSETGYLWYIYPVTGRIVHYTWKLWIQNLMLLRMCSRVSWKVFLQEVVINYEWDEEHRNRNDS